MLKSRPLASSARRPGSVRSRRAVFGVVVALSLIGVAGCNTPSNTPEAYDSTVEANFMNGCTATAPPASTGETGATLGQGATDEYCQCAYNWFVNNVGYSDGTTTTSEGQTVGSTNPEFAAFNFKTLNSDLGDDPTTMPTEIVAALDEACGTSAEAKTPGTTTPTTLGEEVDTAPDDASTSSVPS